MERGPFDACLFYPQDVPMERIFSVFLSTHNVLTDLDEKPGVFYSIQIMLPEIFKSMKSMNQLCEIPICSIGTFRG